MQFPKFLYITVNLCFFSVLLFTDTRSYAQEPFRPLTKDRPAQVKTMPLGIRELETLDNYISVMEKNLEQSQKLKSDIEKYLILQERFAHKQGDKDLCFKMVKAAQQIMKKIEEQHLSHVFDSEFLKELSFFSQLASKRGGARL
jgi:cell fate (sporulation/competence/biofilm development) regulator YlbF (YheA/YmcA/DUF963 family)